MNLLYEDRDIIVCVKDPGVPSQSDKSRDMDMVNMLRNYVASEGLGGIRVGGMPYIGLVHRLDRPVGGVMVFAKNPKALENLNEQVANREIKKSYIAMSLIKDTKIVENIKRNMNDVRHNSELDNLSLSYWINLVDYLVKDARTNTSSVVDKNNKLGKKAELDYRLIGIDTKEVFDENIYRCIFEIYLKTGRHHQIRVQMSNCGMPLAGDVKYNHSNINDGNIYNTVALYSYRLEFKHPRTGNEVKFYSYPKEKWFEEICKTPEC